MNSKKISSYLVLIVIFVIFSGCSSKSLNKKIEKREINAIQKLEKAFSIELKNDILVIADNQFSNIYTDPSIMRNIPDDKISPVAIRPPQVDIFSKELFDLTLKKFNDKNNYIIHLGDSLNIACQNEWDRFKNSINKINKSNFVMAPGNHDFYWFGVSAGFTDGVKREWAISCDDRYPINKKTQVDYSKMFTKSKFINSYLSLLDIDSKYKISNKYDINLYESLSKNSFIDKIYEKRYLNDEKDNYSSFLLQVINIPTKNDKLSLKGIVIDTASYNKKPLNAFGLLSFFNKGSNKNPGLRAGLFGDQKDIIEDIIKEFKKSDQKFMIFGHHPIKSFSKDNKEWINDILKDELALSYNSAHTHFGYTDFNKYISDNKSKDTLEINTGSITDYPNEVRVIKTIGKELVSKLYPISITTINSEFCNPEYDYTSKEYNYLSYQFAGGFIDVAHRTHESTIDISIKTYLRLFNDIVVSRSPELETLIDESEIILERNCFSEGSFFSNDNKICRKDKLNILKKLVFFNTELRNDVEYDNKVQLYGACQSLYGSKAEWIKKYSK